MNGEWLVGSGLDSGYIKTESLVAVFVLPSTDIKEL